jgi:predicted secreted protein
MAQNGTDIILVTAGERFAALTGNEFNPSAALRDTTNKDSMGYKTQEYGLREASMSATGLILAATKNLVPFSEYLWKGEWVISSGTFNEIPVTGPFDLKNAQGVSLDDAATLSVTIPGVAAGNYIFSCWLKTAGPISLEIPQSGGSPVEYDTGSWSERIVLPFTLASLSSVDIIFTAIVPDAELFVYGLQLEAGTEVTTYQPSGQQYDYFISAINSATPIDCFVTNQQTILLKGQCLLSNVSISAPMEENATISAELAITGLVAVEEIPE